jgi:hypothetical protein
MAEIDQLVIKIAADVSDLKSKLVGAGDAVHDFQGRASNHMGLLGRDVHRLEHHFATLFSGLALGFVAFEAFKEFTKDIAKAAIGTDNINNLTSSFHRLTEAIGEAIGGNGGLGKQFQMAADNFDYLTRVIDTKLPVFQKIALMWQIAHGTDAEQSAAAAKLLGAEHTDRSPKYENSQAGLDDQIKYLEDQIKHASFGVNTSGIQMIRDIMKMRLSNLQNPVDRVSLSSLMPIGVGSTLPGWAINQFGNMGGGVMGARFGYLQQSWDANAPNQTGYGDIDKQRLAAYKKTDPRGLFAPLDAWQNQMADQAQKQFKDSQKIGEEWARGIKSGLEDGLVSVGEIIGNAISSKANFGDVEKILGSFAKKIGSLLIGLGIAGLQIQSGAWLANPVAAIAAGVALVAIGAALDNAAATGPTGSGGGGGYSSGGGSYGGSGINVTVTGELHGSTIYLAGQRGQAELSRR